jgi:1-deoxy-D-xylulose-5-phosphate reductoisomerase
VSGPQLITILGATGSIGLSTLDVIARHPDRYQVFALTGFSRTRELLALCIRHTPRFAVLPTQDAARKLQDDLAAAGLDTRVLVGERGLCEVASHPQVDTVMAAIVGAAGLRPTLAAVESGKKVLLANNSEHNAIFQCLPVDYARGLEPVGVRRILLTASGGPFRETPLAELHDVSPEQACAHPNWSMGRKISVDSASMMNKGLELIEACWLFDARPDQIEVVIHPQSVIHSMVDYVDGSVVAQLGNPDMRTPIAHALAWPDRIASGVAPLDLFSIARLDFQAPDEDRFPCLRLARLAAQAGNSAPAMLNAANEVAVAAFLDRRIRYPEIASMIDEVLSLEPVVEVKDLAAVFEVDAKARVLAEQWLSRNGR